MTSFQYHNKSQLTSQSQFLCPVISTSSGVRKTTTTFFTMGKKRKFRLEDQEKKEQFFAVVQYKDDTYDCFNVTSKIRRGLVRILQNEEVKWDFEEKHKDQWYLGKFLYRGGNFFNLQTFQLCPYMS